MTDNPLRAAPPKDGAGFRAIVGLLAVVGGLAIVILLLFVSVPTTNRDAIMLALGLVLGWGSTVVAFEFGSSPAGRKAAEAGIKKAEPETESKP